MANNGISLSTAARTNLLSLQNTSSLIGRTQDRLASGLAVKSATDDAVKFFQAKALSNRAEDLNERKDAIDQGISSLDSTLKATESMEKLMSQMKGIYQSIATKSADERKESGTQLKELISQVQKLVDDSTYQGLNLLNNSNAKLTVQFSDKSSAKLDVSGVDFRASVFYVSTAGAALAVKGADVGSVICKMGGFASLLSKYALSKASILLTFQCRVKTAVRNLDKTLAVLRSKAATMGTNNAILKVRLDFTREYTNVLQGGADKLQLADLNTEAANMTALQTRQQLGVQALSLAGQTEQSILSLLR